MQLNGSRKVIGVLRGYDVSSPLRLTASSKSADWLQVFLNIVLDEAVEEKEGGEKVKIGMVVSPIIKVILRLEPRPLMLN